MEDITIRSWHGFTKRIEEIQNRFSFVEFGGQKLQQTILFRGQADAGWHLQTTLERYSSSEWSALSYLHIVYRCVHQVESITGQNWNLPPFSEIKDKVQSDLNKHSLALPIPEFCVYLRHHGFPSPLLDWTASPYVAAFFALEERVPAKDGALFVYVGGMNLKDEGEPNIAVQTHYVSTHRRHFLQQSWYTICTRFKNGDHNFVRHEEALNAGENPDTLFKIIIPRSNRLEFLSRLATMNINHFSLFQSDESLMKTMAFREIDMQNL